MVARFRMADHDNPSISDESVGSIGDLSEDVVRREQRDHARQESLPF